MFLTDPVLRRIAAATGDVWPDRVWRFDTAQPGPTGELAKLLHDTSLRFTDSTSLVRLALGKARNDIGRTLDALAKAGRADVIGIDRHFTDALAAIGRHSVLEQQLLAQYAAWRHDTGSPQLHGHFHLLVTPGDPSWGVITLQGHDCGHWHVIPDEQAAASFVIGHHAGKVIGTIIPTASVFQPVAHRHPSTSGIAAEQVHGFTACEDPQAACRSLLRWWNIRDADSWDGRYPSDFTADELVALAE